MFALLLKYTHSRMDKFDPCTVPPSGLFYLGSIHLASTVACMDVLGPSCWWNLHCVDIAWSIHSKKRWVVFSTQMLGWDRWVRALGCFNPILGWKLVLIITQRRWVANADVKESTHVTSTSEGTPTTLVRKAFFSAWKKREASERRYGK